VIDFLFLSDEPAASAASSLEKDGHEILEIEPGEAAVRVRLRKAG